MIVGLVLSGVVTAVGIAYQSCEARQITHTSIARRLPTVQRVPAFVSVGSNLLKIGVRGVRFKFAEHQPLWISLNEDGEVMLDGTIRNAGRLVEIRDSELAPLAPSDLDMNWDERELEVVSGDTEPILQVEVADELPHTPFGPHPMADRVKGPVILVRYVVDLAGGGYETCTDNGCFVNSTRTPLGQSTFSYPASRHLHERRVR